MDYSIMKDAFYDELEKIAGFTSKAIRSGRRPYKMENFLKKHASVLKHLKGSHLRDAALLAGGAVGYHTVRTANEDRKLGKQIRLQNQGQ